MNYEEALLRKKELNEKCDEYSKKLNSFEKYDNGLTPDHIRALPEFQQAKQGFDLAFAELRSFNAWFVKTYKRKRKRK